MSDYEKTREERIKQNQNRMEKLGIFDLSLKLKSVKPIRKNNFLFKSNEKVSLSLSPPPPVRPVRRSSRLQNTVSVSYSELQPEKDEASSKRRVNYYTEGSRPEEYTEEHEKLLGRTEMSWTLFVDGCGNDGKRIYDCVKGKTCHQCRQKTLGHRTHCCKCGMVQGQFCGDCLFMRYGENVLEANQNPEWICPVCRGICNCSLCRQAKGWAPTGTLYKKVTQLGFKSVAHYLIQTRRRPQAADSVDKEPTIEDDKNMTPTTKNVLEQSTEVVKVMKQTDEEVKDVEPTTKEVKDFEPNTEEVKESLTPNNDDLSEFSRYVVVCEIDEKLENKTIISEKKLDNTDDELKGKEVVCEIDENLENKAIVSEKKLGNTDDDDDDDDELKGKEVEKNHFTKSEIGNDDDVAGITKQLPKRKSKKITCETGEDSIAQRLRQKRRICN